MLRGIQSYQKGQSDVTYLSGTQYCGSGGSPKILGRALGETRLTTMLSARPPTTVSTRKKTENSSNSLGFTVDVTTNKHQAKQAVKELCGQGQHLDQA